MTLPRWIVLLVAVLVALFGAYRILLAFRTRAADEQARQRGGLYGMGRRTHLLVGIIYLIMAAMLVASSFGFKLL